MELTAFGETQDIDSWIQDRRCVVSKEMLLKRIRLGWSNERSLKTTQKAVRMIQIKSGRRNGLREARRVAVSKLNLTTISSWQIKDFRDVQVREGVIRFRLMLSSGAIIPGSRDRLRPEQIDDHAKKRLKRKIREMPEVLAEMARTKLTFYF